MRERDEERRLTNEGNSFTLLHLKVTIFEKCPVLVTVCESLYREHLLSHSLHSREPAARQQLLFLVCLLKGSHGLNICQESEPALPLLHGGQQGWLVMFAAQPCI